MISYQDIEFHSEICQIANMNSFTWPYMRALKIKTRRKKLIRSQSVGGRGGGCSHLAEHAGISLLLWKCPPASNTAMLIVMEIRCLCVYVCRWTSVQQLGKIFVNAFVVCAEAHNILFNVSLIETNSETEFSHHFSGFYELSSLVSCDNEWLCFLLIFFFFFTNKGDSLVYLLRDYICLWNITNVFVMNVFHPKLLF